MATINGTTGDDRLNGNNNNNIFDISQGGDDTVLAHGGHDVIRVGGALTGLDVIDGGGGSDRLELAGDYSGGVTLDKVTGVEWVELDAGYDYDLTLSGWDVGLLNVEAFDLEADNSLTLDASAVSADVIVDGGQGADWIVTSSGDDSVNGWGGADTIVTGDGDDSISVSDDYTVSYAVSVSAGAGDDEIGLRSGQPNDVGFDQHDSIDGGAGYDIVRCDGVADLALNGINSAGVEEYQFESAIGQLRIAKSAGAGVEGGEVLFQIFSGKFAFDGHLARFAIHLTDTVEDNRISGGAHADIFWMSQGFDTVSGGGGNDQFIFNDIDGRLTPGDEINGGAGSDTVVLSSVDTQRVTYRAETLQQIETLILSGGNIRFDDGNVAAGKSLTVIGQSVAMHDGLRLDGSRETDGRFAMKGGDAGDVLTGGAGADTLTGGLGGDTLTGGAGADRFIYAEVNEGDDLSSDLIKGLEDDDIIDLRLIDANSATTKNDAFHLVGSFTHHAGEAVLARSGNLTILSLDTDGDGSANMQIRIQGNHTDFTNFVL